jgi:hypothetical protein
MDLHQFLSEELEKIDEIYSSFISETADKKAKFINLGQNAVSILNISFLEDVIILAKRLSQGGKEILARAEEVGYEGTTLTTIAEEISNRCKEHYSAFLKEV